MASSNFDYLSDFQILAVVLHPEPVTRQIFQFGMELMSIRSDQNDVLINFYPPTSLRPSLAFHVCPAFRLANTWNSFVCSEICLQSNTRAEVKAGQLGDCFSCAPTL